ncbi:MAG: hypothetical protein IT376_10070 [Polyangiaceae bacterium]|nr:hypothetical protein [Polyangiaceae bacterium]
MPKTALDRGTLETRLTAHGLETLALRWAALRDADGAAGRRPRTPR